MIIMIPKKKGMEKNDMHKDMHEQNYACMVMFLLRN